MYSKNLIDQLKAKKKEYKFTNRDISDRSGVPISTVNKILGGLTKYPRQESVAAIARSLGLEMLDYNTEARGITYMFREVPATYYLDHPESKAKTIKDYYSLPDDIRAELVNGEIVEMATPSVNHQIVVNEIGRLFSNYLIDTKSICRGFPAPFDVQLDKDDYTMLQPDYVIICDRSKYENGKNCYGSPDLVVEVISPSTEIYAYSLKYMKYMYSDVKEYWIIDPVKKKVNVYSFFTNDKHEKYTFDSVVSSMLFKGLSVDFREIDKTLV